MWKYLMYCELNFVLSKEDVEARTILILFLPKQYLRCKIEANKLNASIKTINPGAIVYLLKTTYTHKPKQNMATIIFNRANAFFFLCRCGLRILFCLLWCDSVQYCGIAFSSILFPKRSGFRFLSVETSPRSRFYAFKINLHQF